MKHLVVLLLPSGRDASPSQGYHQRYAASTHLYTWETKRDKETKRKTRKFREELKWNASQWKFSGKKVIPFEVLPFSCFYRSDRHFLYHLLGLPVPGFKSRESEKFTGVS